MEKDIKELNEAKTVHEEKNMELQENSDKVTGKLRAEAKCLLPLAASFTHSRS